MPSSNQFKMDLYHTIAKASNENIFISPYSVQLALGMVSAGAAGSTRAELAEALGVPVDDKAHNHFFKTMADQLDKGDDPYILTVANTVWGQAGFEFNETYRQNIANQFKGSFNTVDFKDDPSAAANSINSRVSAQTNDLIKNLIPPNIIDKDTRLIITSPIYFKGKWVQKFDESQTIEKPFNSPDGAVNTKMMRTTGTYQYFEDDTVQAIKLPYCGHDISMIIMLPQPGKDTKPIDDLPFDHYKRFNASHNDQKVNVEIPRFKIEASYSLKGALVGFGVKAAFGTADFSGISSESLKIGDVLHKALVDVTEEGTEAAAATAVVMKRAMTAAAAAKPKNFVADHPFVFMICKGDEILFIGRFIKPG